MTQLVDQGDGQLSLSGRLTSETVPALEPQGHELITAQHDYYEIDLAEVTFGSSAAVALMLSWLRLAHAAQVEIVFKNLPQGMRGLVRVSKLEDILPMKG